MFVGSAQLEHAVMLAVGRRHSTKGMATGGSAPHRTRTLPYRPAQRISVVRVMGFPFDAVRFLAELCGTSDASDGTKTTLTTSSNTICSIGQIKPLANPACRVFIGGLRGSVSELLLYKEFYETCPARMRQACLLVSTPTTAEHPHD